MRFQLQVPLLPPKVSEGPPVAFKCPNLQVHSFHVGRMGDSFFPKPQEYPCEICRCVATLVNHNIFGPLTVLPGVVYDRMQLLRLSIALPLSSAADTTEVYNRVFIDATAYSFLIIYSGGSKYLMCAFLSLANLRCNRAPSKLWARGYRASFFLQISKAGKLGNGRLKAGYLTLP